MHQFFLIAASGRYSIVMSKIQTEYISVENEQADAGRNCRTRLTRPNSPTRTGTWKYSFSLFS